MNFFNEIFYAMAYISAEIVSNACACVCMDFRGLLLLFAFQARMVGNDMHTMFALVTKMSSQLCTYRIAAAAES